MHVIVRPLERGREPATSYEAELQSFSKMREELRRQERAEARMRRRARLHAALRSWATVRARRAQVT